MQSKNDLPQDGERTQLLHSHLLVVGLPVNATPHSPHPTGSRAGHGCHDLCIVASHALDALDALAAIAAPAPGVGARLRHVFAGGQATSPARRSMTSAEAKAHAN